MIAYDRLNQIVPADQALASKALATSLQQISGITNTTLPVLSNAVVNLQTTRNLDQISALTTAVPASVADYLANIGGANGNTLVICDVLGIAAGYLVTGYFVNTVATLANTNTTYLTTIYQNMNSVVGNVYGDRINGPVVIPVGQPAAGTYYANIGNVGNVSNVVIVSAADNAFTGSDGDDGTGNVLPATGPGLLSVAYPEIANIVSGSPTQVSVMNSTFDSISAQIVREQTLQSDIQIDFANLIPNNNPTVYSLINSLPGYGRETEAGGMAQFWEGVANIDNFTGQAVVAVLREGVNLSYLGNAGITTNGTVPDNPVPPLSTANLIPSGYTADQAANLIAK